VHQAPLDALAAVEGAPLRVRLVLLLLLLLVLVLVLVLLVLLVLLLLLLLRESARLVLPAAARHRRASVRGRVIAEKRAAYPSYAGA
jgi:hypothetical protein